MPSLGDFSLDQFRTKPSGTNDQVAHPLSNNEEALNINERSAA